MDKMIEPCPGCDRSTTTLLSNANNWRQLVCCACGWSGPLAQSKNQAIAAWNTRAYNPDDRRCPTCGVQDPLLSEFCSDGFHAPGETYWPTNPDDRLREALERVAELEAQLNTPEVDDFAKGAVLEAAHQRSRWGADHDTGKTPFDWFWLVGYLAQKAASAAVAGDSEKAKHHTISTASALANWHLALSGTDTRMVPGAPLPVIREADAA